MLTLTDILVTSLTSAKREESPSLPTQQKLRVSFQENSPLNQFSPSLVIINLFIPHTRLGLTAGVSSDLRPGRRLEHLRNDLEHYYLTDCVYVVV